MATANAKNETTGRSTRARILAAAERLFAEDGYGGVSMPAIAKASGITAGAIYRHFESKEGLFFEVLERAVHGVPPVAEPSGAGTDMPTIVANYTTGRLRLLRLLAVETHAASTKHPKVRRLLRRALDRNVADARETITNAQRDGRIDPSLDPERLAATVLVFVMGLMHMETLLPHLVDDAGWWEFVRSRTAALLGERT
jgi:AcrR family transcriptional regulator